MRDRRDVFNRLPFHPGCSQGANRRLASRTRSVHTHLQGADAVIARLVGGVHRGLLSSERRSLARSAEPQRPGTFPGQGAPFTIGDGHKGVVEGGLNVRDAVWHILALFLLENLLFALRRGGCASGRCCCWFSHFYPSERSLGRAKSPGNSFLVSANFGS